MIVLRLGYMKVYIVEYIQLSASVRFGDDSTLPVGLIRSLPVRSRTSLKYA